MLPKSIEKAESTLAQCRRRMTRFAQLHEAVLREWLVLERAEAAAAKALKAELTSLDPSLCQETIRIELARRNKATVIETVPFDRVPERLLAEYPNLIIPPPPPAIDVSTYKALVHLDKAPAEIIETTTRPGAVVITPFNPLPLG
jgi:hypothetical protein